MPEIRHLVVVDEWTGKYMINEAYRPIAEALHAKYQEIYVPADCILFVDNIESDGIQKGKRRFAQIGKIPAKWRDILKQVTDRDFSFMIEFFKHSTDQMSREQIIALIYHEMRHVDIEGNIISHQIEDWANMLYRLGPNWASTKGRIPDLLADGVNWDRIKPVTLFDDSALRVVK